MFKAEKTNDCVLVTAELGRKKDWEFRVLVVSDVHCDNKGFKKNLYKKHMQQAVDGGWPIIDNGDYFDAMGGKYDKRANKADILPELQTSNYFDSLVKYGAELIRPYKGNIIVMAEGNHELSVKDRHEIDLTERLIHELGGKIIKQKYTGWIVFSFKFGTRGTFRATMYRTHGNGGNAPVTKGVIQSARRQDIIDADIYVSGHIHTDYTVQRPKWYLDGGYNVKIKTPVHQQIGTYKDSTFKTWEDMKGFAPPSIGGVWLVFSFDPTEEKLNYRFEPCL